MQLPDKLLVTSLLSELNFMSGNQVSAQGPLDNSLTSDQWVHGVRQVQQELRSDFQVRPVRLVCLVAPELLDHKVLRAQPVQLVPTASRAIRVKPETLRFQM